MNRASLFRHKIQDVGVNVHKLHESDSGNVNILIHGFTAITEESHLKEFEDIASQFPQHTTLLVHWDSGNATKSATSGALSTVATAGSIGLGVFTSGIGGLATRLGVGVASAAGAAGAAFLGAGKGVINAFGENQKKADKLAFALNEILDLSLQNRNITSLNLFGHSLGGRILVKGLLWAHEYINYPINKIVLMGAAVDWPEEPLPILQSSNVQLYNFYSTSDGALTVKTDFEKCIGKHGIPEAKPNIKNILCRDYGHTEYWPTFKKLLDYSGAVPMGNTIKDETVFQEIPMKTINFLTHDDDLYPVLRKANNQELASLAEILGNRKLAGITSEERNPFKIGVEIQLLGGDSVANKKRGYGVNYATIIKDVASYLKIPLQIEEANLCAVNVEEEPKASALKSILRQRFKNTAKTVSRTRDLTTTELEEMIVATIIKQCQSKIKDISDKDFETQMLTALKSSGRDVTVKASMLRSSLGAVGVAGATAACIAVPVIGWAIGAVAVGTVGATAVATTLSSAAYEALIPCIVFINTIRTRMNTVN